MIISHEHKFIYLRTEKTASTSLMQALRTALGGVSDTFEGLVPKSVSRHIPFNIGGLKRRMPMVFGLHTHARAADVRRAFGAEVFDSYFKFAVERNPWDRQVSLFLHRASKEGNDRRDFDGAMRSRLYNLLYYNRLDNWSIYAIGDEVVADRVLRYETLSEELPGLFARLGLPLPELPRKRAEHRTDRRHYATYYTEASRDLVGRWYRREIEAFGYVFEADPAGDAAPASARVPGQPDQNAGAVAP